MAIMKNTSLQTKVFIGFGLAGIITFNPPLVQYRQGLSGQRLPVFIGQGHTRNQGHIGKIMIALQHDSGNVSVGSVATLAREHEQPGRLHLTVGLGAFVAVDKKVFAIAIKKIKKPCPNHR